jgi:tyrosyl-tRNA synthetase
MESGSSQAQFLARNVADCLPEGALAHRIAHAARLGRPLRVKLGLDPTAPDIHLGHTVVLQKLREFQDLGHRVVLIVGDYTARVGDPSGRSSTRPVLSGEEIDANARSYREQAFAVLDSDPDRLEVRHNSEWLDMRVEELFALARTSTLAQLLERDDFSKRYAAERPISILELLYPLLQGYDSVAVEADVELGGTDQTFNLLLARDIQRAYGVAEQCVLTMPILPGTDGVDKMSKSLGNHIGVAESASEMYGKTLSIPDAVMPQWFRLLFGEEMPTDSGPRDAKRLLARLIVTRFHGEAAALAAQAEFDRVFVRRDIPERIAEHVFSTGEDGAVHMPALIADALGGSRSDARRSLAAGGVKLDGTRVEDVDLPADRLDGSVLQVGKRNFRRLRLAKD